MINPNPVKTNYPPKILWLTVLAVLCVSALTFVDQQIVAWVSRHRTEEIIKFFDVISDIGDGTKYFVLALFLLFLGLVNKGQNRGQDWLNGAQLQSFGLLCLKVMILTGLVVLLIKTGLGRSRPDLWVDHNILAFSPFEWADSRDFKSFPSGHTQTAFTVAVLMTLLLPRKLYPLVFCLAGLVGISRVILLAHWPSDVVAGAFIGFGIPVLMLHRLRLFR